MQDRLSHPEKMEPGHLLSRFHQLEPMCRRISQLELCATDSFGPQLHGRPSEIHTWPDLQGKVFAHCYLQDGTYWIELPELSAYAFSNRAEQVTAFFNPRVPAELVRQTYWRSVLPMVLQARGTEVLHASGVLMPEGVVALCGKSWSGKSTAAYALSRRGYKPWADDAVTFEQTEECVLTTRLPFRIQLRPASQAYFCAKGFDGEILSMGSEQDGEDSAPLVALCVLTPSSKTTKEVQVFPLPEAEAFRTLLSHAYCFSLNDRERKRQMIERYMNLSIRVPVLQVQFAPDLERISALIDAIVAGVQAFSFELQRIGG